MYTKKAFIFTLSALLILLFVVTYFGFKTNALDASLQGPNIRTEKMNNYLRDLFDIYLPQSVQSSMISGFEVLSDYMDYRGEYLADPDCEIRHAFSYARYDVSNYNALALDSSRVLYAKFSNASHSVILGANTISQRIEVDDAFVQPFVLSKSLFDIQDIRIAGDVEDYNGSIVIEVREESCGHMAGGYILLFEDSVRKNQNLDSYPFTLTDSRVPGLKKGVQYYLVIRILPENPTETPMLDIIFGTDNDQKSGSFTSNYHTIPDADETISGFYDQFGYLLGFMEDNFYIQDIVVDFPNMFFDVYHTDPFVVMANVSFNLSITMDETTWKIENEDITIPVDLEYVADPLVAPSGLLRYIKAFDFSLYAYSWFSPLDSLIFEDYLQSFGRVSYYVPSKEGPSFLERFTGLRQNFDGYGIESFVTYAVHPDYSNVDYLFMNKTGLELYNNVTNFNREFIVDKDHCAFYNLSCTCGVNNITSCT